MKKQPMKKETIYNAAEIAITYKVNPAPSEAYKITCSRDIYNLMIELPKINENIQYKEMFFSILLNNANEVIAVHKISEGTTTSTPVDIKFILQGAILANASNIIICHNHPSGRLEPSNEDKKITIRIQQSAEIFNIKLLDSLILSINNYFSFTDNGII
jgi:DNA repair protein RadC